MLMSKISAAALALVLMASPALAQSVADTPENRMSAAQRHLNVVPMEK